MTQGERDTVEFYADTNNYGKLKDMCLKLLGSNPKDTYLTTKLVYAYYNLVTVHGISEYEEVFLQTCEDGLLYTSDPLSRAYILDYLTLFWQFVKDYVKAEMYSKEALALDPNNAMIIARHAASLAYLGDRKTFEKMAEQALSIDPNCDCTLMMIFDVYHQLYNEKDMEKNLIEKILPLDDDPFRVNWRIADHHWKYGEYEEAYEFYIKAVQIQPNNERLQQQLLYVEEVLDVFSIQSELAKELKPEDAVIFTSLLDESDGCKCEEMLSFCKNIDYSVKDDPRFIYIYANATLVDKENFDLCEELCKRILQHPKIGKRASVVLGCNYYNMKEYEKAYPYMKAWNERNPSRVSTRQYLAHCLAEMGRVGESLACLEYGLYLSINNLYILEFWYTILYRYTDNLDDELAMLERTEQVMLSRDFADFCPIKLYKAMTYEKYEQFDNALTYLEGLDTPDAAQVKARVEKRKRDFHGRSSLFSEFEGKQSGRQTYPLSAWEDL